MTPPRSNGSDSSLKGRVRPRRGSCAGAMPTAREKYVREATAATATPNAQAFAL